MRRAWTLSSFLVVLATSANAITTWVHPGALESSGELAFTKEKIKTGAQPWSSMYTSMRGKFAIPGDGAIPALNNSDPNSKTNEDAQKVQAQRAYGNALAYKYSGTSKYADQAVAILLAWADVQPYVAYNGQLYQSMLDCAWIGTLLGPAAELVRDYMQPDELAKVKTMFKTVFVPSLSKMDPSNGNRDLTQIDALFSIAVFLEDATLFEMAKTRLAYRIKGYIYLKADGSKPTSIPGAGWDNTNMNTILEGTMQETCRDADHHAQFALAAVLAAVQVAWNQNEDLYTVHKDRLVAAMELQAKQITTGSMQGVCTNGDATTTELFNTFEIGYSHYHNIVGLPMTNTEAVLTKIKTGASDWNIFYETLTHHGTHTEGVAVRPLGGGSAPLQVTLLGNNTCEIQAHQTGRAQFSVLSIDGKRLSQSVVSLVAGEKRTLALGLDQAPKGIYLVQVRSSEGNTVLKLSK